MQSRFLLTRELNNQVECCRLHSPLFYPHFHSNLEIYLILSGEIEVLVNDQKKILGVGEFSVALSYDTHGYRTPKEAEAIFLSIPTSFCEEFLSLLSTRCLPSPYLNDPKTYETVQGAMEALLRENNEISRRGLLYVILGAVFDQMTPNTDGVSLANHSFSAEILIYISRHFKEDLSLSQVAKEFGYHPSYLSRYFRKTVGIPFVRYLTMLRLREAVLLLRTENQTVTSCAMESGFGSMRSFYRAFYEEFGCSPKEYLSAEKQKSIDFHSNM
ncbi:MAG: helix-turn-helix domain-containing protein [Ruminococcaceae bacterium]|nr:helix-turn-helix domain-containing protein [Oscillospiraceae bacterium]